MRRQGIPTALKLSALVALVAVSLLWPRPEPAGAVGVPAAAVTTALDHSCALTAAGGLECWGRNSDGQLGDGQSCGFQCTTPVDVSGLTNGVAAVTAGIYHTCALTTAGGVKCWGGNGYGQLGDGTTTNRTTPVDVDGLASGVAAIAAGSGHTCAVTTAGGLKCWGRNIIGQLGDGTTTNRTTPVDVFGLASGVAAVSPGNSHTCALTTGGGIKCWGQNSIGQLGDGTTTNRTTPVDVSGLTSSVASVSTGGNHSCALTTAGGIKCWGDNFYGQLGDGQSCGSGCLSPVDVSGLSSGAAGVSAGWYHTCALTTAGGVKCWGDNDYGQLGDGTTTQRTTPVDVSGLTSGAAAVAAGSYNTCALTTAGGLKCWGDNVSGQLGDGTTTQRTTPVDVAGFTSPAVAAGAGHTCAVTTAGGVKCWGANDWGELGDGTTTDRTTPLDVIGLASGVAAVSAGDDHSCALTTAGGIKCWGRNAEGQLGDGQSCGVQCTTPVDVSGLTSGVAAVSAGLDHTCALTTAGGVKCWGWNLYGQLGDGTTTDRTTPVDVSGLTSGAAAVAAGAGHTCALTTAGGVKCWGYNAFGQVGDGTSGNIRTTPVDVSGLTSGVAGVSAGLKHTCALTTAGGLKCWGLNNYGQLGDEQSCGVPCTAPVDVSGLSSGVAAVSAGVRHTCALTTAGGLKCWGWNAYGQLGDGTTTDRTTPVEVSGLSSAAAAVSAGWEDTCALTMAGGLQCWGHNLSGQLGDGTYTDRTTPVDVVDSRGDTVTPVDTNVVVSLGNGVTLTFDDVKESGTTTLTTSEKGPAPPDGFQFLGLLNPSKGVLAYFEISSTATFNENIEVCIDYDDSGMGPLQEIMLRLYHEENGEFVQITTEAGQVNPSSNRVCGTVQSFSPFVFVQLIPEADFDGDGCTNGREVDSNENQGGRRDPQDYWDFFDVWTHPPGDPSAWVRDKVVNLPGDILGVAARFGSGPPLTKEEALAAALATPTAATGYHAAYDRGTIVGEDPWDRAPPDGAINIVDDILGVARQFGHSCA